MASNSMNDMPSFTTVDTSGLDNNMYSQTVPIQMNNLDQKVADSIENITIPVQSTVGGSLQPMMNTINTNLPSTMPISSSPMLSVPIQNHVPINTMNHAATNPMNHVSTIPMNQVPTNSMNQVPSNPMHQIPTNTMNHMTKQPASSSQSTVVNTDQILTKTRLQDLVKEIDPCEQLDEEVEDLLLQLVDDFVNSTVNTACVFAKHRNAATVEVKDVQLYLEKMYQMWIPGFGSEEVKPYKKPPVTEAHKQRLALIRKSLKKY
ncbi:hypothetical protein V9T40_007196 [Parthenolecanium corni]|uniref:Transcription initiation factor TFIID subunit 12 n=1 Tax=Parthenolecanium corni TaxID=536013 RepID=A0AAN9TVZ9_9HEMI